MKFAICNLGCKVNNYEANWYQQQLASKYEEVSFNDIADIYVINTCTVTNKAGSKSRQMIHRARHKNPQAVIVAIGCYVQIEFKNEEYFEDCDIIIGSKDKKQLPALIEKFLQTKEKIKAVEKFETCEFEQMEINDFNQTRAYLKIQDGCNQFCSYCVIPYARGRERCLKSDLVIAQAQSLVKAGHIEIVLTGIHTGRYLDQDLDLTGLIKRLLNEVKGLERIRLSSIEMTEVSDELIQLMAQDKRIARHLHIPLQTGTDRMLKLNNRPYTTTEYKAKIDYIRSLIPDISISSDVIAALPTETAVEALETEQFISDCKLSFMHVFPYAKKEHTPDALLKQVNDKEKSMRAASLTALKEKLYNNYINKFLNCEVEVIFETCENNLYQGHCSQYINVVVESDVDIRKQLKKVYITKAENATLFGILVEGD